LERKTTSRGAGLSAIAEFLVNFCALPTHPMWRTVTLPRKRLASPRDVTDEWQRCMTACTEHLY